MVSYKRSGFVRSAFSVSKNVTSDVRGLESSDRVLMAAAESKEMG